MGQTTLTESLGAIETEIAAGQAERALARCQEIQTRYPRALAVQRVLGEAWLALRKPREALGALDRTLAGNPEDVRACCARAIVHQMHGDAAAALSWYRRACDVRPDDQALRATYLEMASQIGQPAYRPTRVGLARLYLRGGLFTHAIREWELLLAERADLLDAQVGLMETLWRAGRLTQADEWARRTLVNAPSCEKALLISAIIAHDAEQTDEAERLMQRVSLLDPDQRMAQALFADRLAAGDRALAMLLWGPDAPEPQPPYSPPTPQTPPTTRRPGPSGDPALSPAPSAAPGLAAPSTPSAYVGGQSAPSVGFGRSPQPTSPQQPPFPSSASAQSAPRVSRTNGPVASGPINDRLIRPLVDSRPAPQTSGPMQRSAATPSRPLGAPLAMPSEMGGGPGGQPGLASAVGPIAAPVAATRTQPLPPSSHASALPSTFGNIFKETEGMIWGLDDTESMDHPDALTGPIGAVGFDSADGTGMARP
ncbi:MAG TPA: tetratricopeptide repeat protein, partial [Ktedonobacterales bacterium]|nr:tetratricopeptide repeat protein [Ktedonobacterales bacterium]